MSDWKEIRGYAVSVGAADEQVNIYLYCGGYYETAENNCADDYKQGRWRDTEKHSLKLSPAKAAIAIDLLRNEKGLSYNPSSKWIYASPQEGGVGELTNELAIKTY